MGPRDWDDADSGDDARYDSYATARVLSRLGDNRYGTELDAVFDPDVEVWPPSPHTPHPGTAGRTTN